MNEHGDTYEDYMLCAQMCMSIADGFRTQIARRWHDVSFVRRMIREYQGAAITWALEAQKLREVGA